MNVLIACEFSGIVRDTFIKRGHDAVSCDILPSESPGPHIQGDVTPLLKENWDLIIAHPPCKYLANSGVRWLWNGGRKKNGINSKRWDAMEEATLFFKLCLNASSFRVAVENPIIHKYARHLIGREMDFTIQPWEFGHGETKRTCFWTRKLDPLVPSEIVEGRYPSCHLESPCPDRWKNRSRTLQGIADAMVDQWGKF